MPIETVSSQIDISQIITESAPIRVVVADDSSFVRKALTMLLNEEPNINVVGAAANGKECLDLVESLQPDLLTLDVDMPFMDGLSTLKIMQHEFPLPVIMISSLTVEGAEATFEALDLGAMDYIAKQLSPQLLDIDLFREELIRKVTWAARQGKSKHLNEKRAKRKPQHFIDRAKNSPPIEVVGIGASTGGPKALQKIIPELPGDFPLPVLVAQHIPQEYSCSLAARMDKISNLSVREANNNEVVTTGVVYIAPGGNHLEITDQGRLNIIPNQPGNLACPSINRMLVSLAQEFGESTLGVIMTGMGDDGVEGARQIQARGGMVLAQDEATSLAYSMPKCVVEQGLANREAPLELITSEILRLI